MPRLHDVDTLTDLAGLLNLRDCWSVLAPSRTTEPWQSFNWIVACAESDRKIRRFHLVTVRYRGKLTAIAPFALRESSQPLHPLRLDFLGGEDIKEPNHFVSSNPESLELLVESLASERTYPIRLSRIPNERSLIEVVNRTFRARGWLTRMMSVPYPYLDLDDGSSLIKKSLEEDLRRARRKAEKKGGVTSEVADVPSREDLLRHLECAFRIEASGWKGRNKTAILCDEYRRTFFVSLADSASKDGTFRLVFLKIGGQESAVHYALESANQYWLLNIGYRDDFKEFSPGNLLLEESIRKASKNGLTRYNFLGKEEPWTRRWTSTVRDCVVVAAYRPNLHGVRAIVSDALYLYRKHQRDRLARRVKNR